MKKLLSVILAGALALTAVSPAFAATSDYENSKTEGIYYDVNFSDAADVEDGGALNTFLNTASKAELRWEARATSTITKVKDPIKGNVAKIATSGNYHPRIWLDKGNYKNGFTTGSSATNSTILEFSFKVENYTSPMFFYDYALEPNGSTYPYFYFETDGSVVGKRSGTYANAFKTNGEWNHAVIEFGTTADNGLTSNYVRLWINGVYVAYHGASSGAANFSSETWGNVYFGFCADGSGAEQNIYISNFTKYEIAGKRYWPEDAGNAPATITASGDVISVGNALYYNPAKVTNTTQLLSNLTVSSGVAPVVVVELDGVQFVPANEVDLVTEEEGSVKYVVAKSTSGDQLTYYTIGEQEATQVTYKDLVDVDEEALTVSFKEADLPTVGDLADQFTATGGSAVKFFDASGVEITDRTASSTTVKTVRTYSITGMIEIDYAVSCAPATYSYIDLDWSKTAHTLPSSNVLFRYGISGSLVDDADMGYKVWKAAPTESAAWGGIANDEYTGQVADGDKFIIEATVKPHTNKAGNLFMTIKNNLASNADYTPFEFSSINGGNTITFHGTGTYPFEADKWYHIVSEYTVSASGSVVNQWVNGVQVTTEKTIAALTTSHFNTQLADNEQLRLCKGSNCTDTSVAWSVARYSLRQSAYDYNEVTEGDAAAITADPDAEIITIDPAKFVINVADTTMTVAGLKDALTVSEGATVKYLGTDGAEVADTASVSSLKKITVLSQSKNRHIAYDVTKVNVESDVYKVTDGAISGVKMYTTEAQLLANLSAVEDITVDMDHDTWVSNGDVVTVGTLDYRVALEDVAHVDGTALPSDGFNMGHFSYTPQFVADATRGGDTVILLENTHRTYSTTDKEGNPTTGSQYARICFPGGTAGTNGNGTPALKPGESVNIEFAMKANGKVYGHLIVNNNFVWYLDGETMGVNQPSSGNNYILNPFNISPMSYTIGDWMHVVSSVKRDSEGNYSQKLYINGDLVHQGGTSTQNSADALVLEILGYDKDVEVDIWLDDIKYYYTDTWGFDASWQYKLDVESFSEDVVVANGEVWLSNGATVEDAIGVDIYNADGTAIDYEDYATLAAGDKFYVYAGPIIKPYTVRNGAIGSEISEAGVITVNVGMIDDARKAAIFVAGVDENGKFTNIFKKTKAAGDDTIEFDVISEKIEASKVNVYVWDSSLRVLTGVEEFVMDADGVWSDAQ